MQKFSLNFILVRSDLKDRNGYFTTEIFRAFFPEKHESTKRIFKANVAKNSNLFGMFERFSRLLWEKLCSRSFHKVYNS